MEEVLSGERISLEAAVAMAADVEDGMHGEVCEIGDLSADRTVVMASSLREGPVILHWGHRKRPRCSRVDNHLKNGAIASDQATLLRKTVRIKAQRFALTEIIRPKNGIRERPPRLAAPAGELHASGQGGQKRATIFKAGAPEFVRGVPPKETRGPFLPCHTQNTHLPHLSKTRASPDCNSTAPYRSAGPMSESVQQEAAQIEIDWPKFLISLSRKEKEDDFSVIKGTKLPQRPKRRPKLVERAVHFCTPGNWLTDLSRGRYDVREKKCLKKKPRGLKAMESMDTDSE